MKRLIAFVTLLALAPLAANAAWTLKYSADEFQDGDLSPGTEGVDWDPGDVMVVWGGSNDTSPDTMPSPAGFTCDAQQAHGSNANFVARFCYRALQTGDTTFTFNSSGTELGYVYAVFEGGSGSLDASTTYGTGNCSGGNVTAPTNTVATAGALGVRLYIVNDDDTGALNTPSEGTMGPSRVSGAVNDGKFGISYLTEGSTGATGTATVACQADAVELWMAGTVLLEPAGSPTINLTPDPVALGGTVTVNASDFGGTVDLLTEQAGGDTLSVTTDEATMFALSDFTSTGDGNNTQWATSLTWEASDDGSDTAQDTLTISAPATSQDEYAQGTCTVGADCPPDSDFPPGFVSGDYYYARQTSGSAPIQISDSGVPMCNDASCTIEIRSWDVSAGAWTDPIEHVLGDSDSTAPMLTSATISFAGDFGTDGTLTISATSDEAGGTMYYCIHNTTTRSAAEIKAETGCDIADNFTPVLGLNTVIDITTAAIVDDDFQVDWVQDDASSNESNVASSATTAVDNTAPVLSSASASSPGPGLISLQVTTDEACTLAYYITGNSSEAPEDVYEEGDTTAATVGANSVSNVPVAGGDWYAHMVCVDAAGNGQASATSTSQVAVDAPSAGECGSAVVAPVVGPTVTSCTVH